MYLFVYTNQYMCIYRYQVRQINTYVYIYIYTKAPIYRYVLICVHRRLKHCGFAQEFSQLQQCTLV